MIFSYYVVKNMHSDLLQVLIHKEVCNSFRSTYVEMFEHIKMTKYNIPLKSVNTCQTSCLTRNTNKGMTVKQGQQRENISFGDTSSNICGN